MKIKDCPHCNSKKIVLEETPKPNSTTTETTGHYVECCNCGASTAAWGSQSLAVKAWNKRVKSLTRKEFAKREEKKVKIKAIVIVEEYKNRVNVEREITISQKEIEKIIEAKATSETDIYAFERIKSVKVEED